MTTEKGPTQADREKAKEIVTRYANPSQYDDNMEEQIVAAIAAAREQGRAESTPPPVVWKSAPPKGHVLDCTGDTPVVRRVLGTLPVTADGVVAMPGTEVFHPDQDTYFHLEVMRIDWSWKDDEFPLPENCEYVAHYSYYEHDTGFSTRETYDVGACYSTREAALAERESA